MADDPLGGVRDWLRKLEVDIDRLEAKSEKFGDEIKNTIRFEVAVLKTESIADIRRRVDDGYKTLEKFDERMRLNEEKFDKRIRANENAIREWNAGRSVIGWMINAAIGIASGLAGYFGAKHF